ncbi:MAG: GntR family transcriptional regulator [Pirellulales bacterium]|nr:GntR family transcriptional regulator [Pirellulales bacterium]
MPIYEQIVRQVKFAVAGRIVKSGEMIPSVREVARALAINPNTVAKAYRQLQLDGVLEPVRGEGLQVAPGAVEPCVRDRLALIRARLRQVLGEARRSHLDARAIGELVQGELDAIQREEVSA